MALFKKQKILYGSGRFFGWSIVLGCLIGVLASSGPLVQVTLGVFMSAMNTEFGWSRGEVSFIVTIYTAVTAALVPIVGRFMDRYGVKRILLPAVACSAILFMLPALIKELWHFYLAIFVYSIAGSVSTSLPYTRIISTWFDKRRGLLLGIVAGGVGIGFAIIPPLSHQFMVAFGWRGAYIALGLCILLVVVPALAFLIKDEPGDVGLKPDGTVEKHVSPSASPAIGLTLREAARTRVFWVLLLTTFAFSFFFNGILIHTIPLLNDHGFEPSQAVFAASLLGISMLIARIVIGFFLDVMFAPRLAIITFLLGSAGLLLLALNLPYWVNLLAVVLVGIGMGAEADIVAFATSRYFGLKSFGRIYGCFFAFFYVGIGLGPLTLGLAHDRTGSYSGILIWYTVFCVAVTMTFLLLGPYRYQKGMPANGAP
jgi:MFS family permease